MGLNDISVWIKCTFPSHHPTILWYFVLSLFWVAKAVFGVLRRMNGKITKTFTAPPLLSLSFLLKLLRIAKIYLIVSLSFFLEPYHENGSVYCISVVIGTLSHLYLSLRWISLF